MKLVVDGIYSTKKIPLAFKSYCSDRVGSSSVGTREVVVVQLSSMVPRSNERGRIGSEYLVWRRVC